MSFCLSRCPPTRTKRNQVPPQQRKHHATSHTKPSYTDSSNGNSVTETAVSTRTNDAIGITSGALTERLGNETTTSKVPIPSFAHAPLHSFSFSDDEEDPFLKSIRPTTSPRVRSAVNKKPIRIPSFALPARTTMALEEEQEQKPPCRAPSPVAPAPPDEPTALDTSSHDSNTTTNNTFTEMSIQTLFQQHVDPLFLEADNDQWTVKQFLKETQSRIQRPLTANEKQCVRKRLKELVNGRVVPQSESAITRSSTTDQLTPIMEEVSKDVECAPGLDEERGGECSPSMESISNSLNESLDGKCAIPMDSTEHLENKKPTIVGDPPEESTNRGPLKQHVDCERTATDPTKNGRVSSHGLAVVEDADVMERTSNNLVCKERTSVHQNDDTSETLAPPSESRPATLASPDPLMTVETEGIQTKDAIREEKAPLAPANTTDGHRLQVKERNLEQKMESESSGIRGGALREQTETPPVQAVDSSETDVSGKEVQDLEESNTTEVPQTGQTEQHVGAQSLENGSNNNIPVPTIDMDVDKENIPSLEPKPKRRTYAKRSKKIPASTELPAAPSNNVQPKDSSSLPVPPQAPVANSLNSEAKPSAPKRRQYTKRTKGESKQQDAVAEKAEIVPLPVSEAQSKHPVSTTSAVGTLDKTAVVPIPDSKPEGGRPARKPLEPPTQKATATATTTRKRPRKGSCALCLTCPCLKPLGGTDAEENFFNQNTFSRSEAAMEKAYIRRIQKLEKTCEHYEGQVETVRRKLKQHRRDMWKRHGPDHQDTKGGQKKKTNYFLPDVKELEASASLHPDAIPPELVGVACRAIFPDTPCYQPTLTQILGVRSKKSETEGSDVRENDVDEDPPEMEIDGHNESAIGDGIDEHTEYVASPKGDITNDRAKRVEWHATVLSCDENGKESVAAPIWKSMVTFEGALMDPEASTKTIVLDRNVSEPALPIRTNGGGIDELAGLFDEYPETSNSNTSCTDPSPSVSTDITVPPCPSGETSLEPPTKVDLAMLSPRGRKEACDMIDTIEQDPHKLSLISRGCPEWKENMAFAMYQQDPVAIGQALDNVMEKRHKLLDWQRRMMESFQAQKEALDVLEEGLKRSLGRLDQGGFLSQAVVMGEDIGEDEDDDDQTSIDF